MSELKWNFAHEESFNRTHRMIADQPAVSSQMGDLNFLAVPWRTG